MLSPDSPSPRLPKITVCIPAYRSHDFIRDTLQSVQKQTFLDFRVVIAVERTEDCQLTVDAAAPFLSDPRFCLTTNDSVLGWAENIRTLLENVTTPYFAILPHDDSWSEDYLAKLLSILEHDPGVAAAYTDIQTFGHKQTCFELFLDNTTLLSRLLSFYCSGARAVHFRGLTRSSVLSPSSFPTNEFSSFAVECVWSSLLLTKGRVLRCSEASYQKRLYQKNSANVSGRWRTEHSDEWILGALKTHRRQMKLVLKKAALTPKERSIAELTCEGASMKRSVEMLADRPRLVRLYLEPIRLLLDQAKLVGLPHTAPISSLLEYAHARALKILARFSEAEDAAQRAIVHNPKNWEACVLLSLLLSRRGQASAALKAATDAAQLAPHASEVQVAHEVSKNAGQA